MNGRHMCPVDRWKWLVRRRPAPIYQKQLASPGVVRSSNATVLLDVHHITSFFLNQQFITWGAKAVRGHHFFLSYHHLVW